MKILIADDEPVALRLLESLLCRWGYEVLVARNGVEASQILLSPDAPKMAILDWMMPGMDGVQLCRDLRRTKEEPYTYILLLTGKRTQDDVIAGLDAGADDYVRKPFDPAELKVRLRTGKRILFLQEQLIAAREALRDQATHDSLTGLWNRQAILDILESERSRCLRQGAPVSIAFADVDLFKQINDSHGHLLGDQVLRDLAKVLRESVRRYDSVARFGDEEFLIVFPGCDQTNALAHAERIRAAVAQTEITADSTTTIRPTMSFGVAVTEDSGSGKVFDLIQAADKALYRAKRHGRNRVELASPADTVAV